MRLPFVAARPIDRMSFRFELAAISSPLERLRDSIRRGTRYNDARYNVGLRLREELGPRGDRTFVAVALGSHSSALNCALWTRLYNL